MMVGVSHRPTVYSGGKGDSDYTEGRRRVGPALNMMWWYTMGKEGKGFIQEDMAKWTRGCGPASELFET